MRYSARSVSRLLLTLLTAALPLGATTAQAAGYPAKPIRLIVPYGAGGPTDIHLRMVSKEASATLGQPIIVENKPGANGTFGAAELAHARPDGYTLAVIPASVYREPHLNRVHFDPLKLTYVIGLSDYTFGLAVKQDAPWQTWQDFVEDARKRPGKISIGAAGPVQTPNIVLGELAQQTGLDVIRAPYKGDSEQAQDLMGGHIDAGVLSGVASTYIRSGHLRYLVMFTPERSRQFPDVPTLRELGVDSVIDSPYGIAGPKDLPEQQVQIIHDAFRQALASPAGKRVLEQLNQPESYRSPAELTAYATQAYAREKDRMEQFKATLQ